MDKQHVKDYTKLLKDMQERNPDLKITKIKVWGLNGQAYGINDPDMKALSILGEKEGRLHAAELLFHHDEEPTLNAAVEAAEKVFKLKIERGD